MRFYSRAGLIVLSLAIFFTTITTAAPIAATSPSLNLRSGLPDGQLLDKGSQTCIFLSEHQSLSQCTVASASEAHYVSLVRRKSIFTKIKEGFKKLGKGIKKIAKKIGGGIKKVAKKIGGGIKKVAKKIGGGIKKVAKKIGHGIKTAAQKVGKGIKTAAKKVGKFIKTTGAKVAKFGLKIVSTVASVASKVVKFIPGVGTVLSKGLSAGAMGANAASNAIHVKLPGKLEKGMKIMDKIRNPVGGAAGKMLNILRRDEDHIASRDFVDFDEYELVARELAWESISEREWDNELDARGLEHYDPEERNKFDARNFDDDAAFYERAWDDAVDYHY